MKKIIITILLILFCVGIFVGCNHVTAGLFKDPPTTAITLLYDVTDPMAVRPNSSEISGLFNFSDNDIYNGYELRIRRLSMVNLTSIFDLQVPAQNKLTGDQMQRVALVKGFRKSVQSHIDSLDKEKVTDEPYSVLYTTIAQELDHISTINTNGGPKICVIYSDLIENSEDGNFYSATQFAELKKNPQAVIKRLEKIVPLDNLKGLQVYVVYKPKSYTDELRFDAVAAMYNTMLTAKGATFTVGANLVTQ